MAKKGKKQVEVGAQRAIRQGDVLLIPVGSIPEGATEEVISGEEIVLAEGEATGHRHAFNLRMDPGAVDMLMSGGQRYARTGGGGATLYHGSASALGKDGDHAPVKVPPGQWRVTIQREYRWGEERQVSD